MNIDYLIQYKTYNASHDAVRDMLWGKPLEFLYDDETTRPLWNMLYDEIIVAAEDFLFSP